MISKRSCLPFLNQGVHPDADWFDEMALASHPKQVLQKTLDPASHLMLEEPIKMLLWVISEMISEHRVQRHCRHVNATQTAAACAVCLQVCNACRHQSFCDINVTCSVLVVLALCCDLAHCSLSCTDQVQNLFDFIASLSITSIPDQHYVQVLLYLMLHSTVPRWLQLSAAVS